MIARSGTITAQSNVKLGSIETFNESMADVAGYAGKPGHPQANVGHRKRSVSATE
jgi:hypothetical protein